MLLSALIRGRRVCAGKDAVPTQLGAPRESERGLRSLSSRFSLSLSHTLEIFSRLFSAQHKTCVCLRMMLLFSFCVKNGDGLSVWIELCNYHILHSASNTHCSLFFFLCDAPLLHNLKVCNFSLYIGPFKNLHTWKSWVYSVFFLDDSARFFKREKKGTSKGFFFFFI